MADQLTKLRPDRDLQCYFQEPSTAAALSATSSTGFTVSGCWRQQFDWAVVEWNRDNVFEHPALRNLPDGDLSGVHLTYDETRTNCIPLDSTTWDAIGWSSLRIWEQSNGTENLHFIPLKAYATPAAGTCVPATAVMVLEGTPTIGDMIELAWLEDHVNYVVAKGDTLESVVGFLAGFINAPAKQAAGCAITAAADGAQITLTYNAAPGSNGNRVGIYGGVHGAGTESWSPAATMFSGGTSPQTWTVDLTFNNLRENPADPNSPPIPVTNVRRVRWTWAADLQAANYARSEFSVAVTNWQVSGTNLTYSVAGPGSRRIEDDSATIAYSGSWVCERGNYSGGSSHYTANPGDHLSCTYSASGAHTLYLGTRYLDGQTNDQLKATIQVDRNAPVVVDLKRPGEDVLIRYSLGQLAGGAHTVTVTHSGTAGKKLYFDFLEIAVPSANLPSFATYPTSTLATDWDTNHSLALAPERTAWLIHTLGFKGRANHYVGAMWWYELSCPGNQFASATVEFAGNPQFGDTTQIVLSESTVIQHVNLTSDTPASIAKCFEMLMTAGTSSVWAKATGATLTITARAMGTAGNSISLVAHNSTDNLTVTVSSANLSGGSGPTADLDAAWRTDLTAMPRLNRAARDWSTSFYAALKGYGIDVAASFSTELRHGDDSLATGIAQRYPDAPVWVNTPALQTNFSPASAAFWQQVYLDMANVMAAAGVRPYLQFGEIQWWYFADASGMPFYDAYTQSTFQAANGKAMGVITSQNADPAAFPQECAFLPGLIGAFTKGIRDFVRQSHSDARFEVLYPPDVNDTPLNRIINFPASDWTAANLTCLKTENFTYTGNRDLNKARASIGLPLTCGFSPAQSSHLVGIGEYTTPWDKERRLALGAGLESVVLFALDQFCLIGYALPLSTGQRRSGFMGK